MADKTIECSSTGLISTANLRNINLGLKFWINLKHHQKLRIPLRAGKVNISNISQAVRSPSPTKNEAESNQETDSQKNNGQNPPSQLKNTGSSSNHTTQNDLNKPTECSTLNTQLSSPYPADSNFIPTKISPNTTARSKINVRLPQLGHFVTFSGKNRKFLSPGKFTVRVRPRFRDIWFCPNMS